MNDQLQAQVTQILSQIMVSVGEVKDFSMQQLPEIAQQYVQYGIVSSIFFSVICLVILIGSSVALRISIKKQACSGIDDWFALSVVSGLAISLSFPFLCTNIHNLILALTAPKVWFILQLKEMIS